MSLQLPQMKVLFNAVLGAYPDIEDFRFLLLMELDTNLDDIAPDNLTRPARIMRVIKTMNARNAEKFITAVINDPQTAGNTDVQQNLPPLLLLLNPQPGAKPHEHLVTGGAAFANRTSLRMDVARMLRPDGPKVLVVRGASLSGSSYAFRLINHVAKQEGIQRITLNFAHSFDNSPLGVATALADEMRIPDRPILTDDPGNVHLAGRLVRWLGGHIRASDDTWWVVFDNAQLASVPPETKEMIVAFCQYFASDVLNNARLFVLGFDLDIAGVGPPDAEDMSLHCIGRPEIVDFLTQAQTIYGPLPGFGSVEEAADEIIDGIDLQSVSREGLTAISEQLTFLIAEMQQ